MTTRSTLQSELLSHPNKPLIKHITNMLAEADSRLLQCIKIYHDIAKLKTNFQIYIKNPTEKIADKNHALLSSYIFLLNSEFNELDTAFGFLSIVSHHGNVENFCELTTQNKNFGKYFESSKELDFWDEVLDKALGLEIYKDIKSDKNELLIKAKHLREYSKFTKKKFDYDDFLNFKDIFSSLIYSDKYEAIFNQRIPASKPANPNTIEKYIKVLENRKPNEKRSEFRKFVLNNFDVNHNLFTLTAPTGYGKTLTALNFAAKFNKERIIYVLPFTAIIDQVYDEIKEIFKDDKNILIHKIHHKTTIDESTPQDRYSKVKFLMDSFSGDINVTTLYQFIFALFGNKNKDSVKFNRLKNSVIIIDEAQAVPYKFRADFMKLCEMMAEKFGCIFIFMSATMPIVDATKFKEISNLDYFKDQNRYVLKWFDGDESTLKDKIRQLAKGKNTLVVVNTIKKAQELFLEFCDEFKVFCLNGYMCDDHKRKNIENIKDAIAKNKSGCGDPILLISTQSIEAGVDLDFDVGFREIAPISSIIQTAGRINRNFAALGELYVFNDICDYSDLIYGDLKRISDNILIKILKQRYIIESEILDISTRYFSAIKQSLESLFLAEQMRELGFYDINEKISAAMDDRLKILVIIEPKEDYIKEFQNEIFEINRLDMDKFNKKDIFTNTIKKINRFGVNITEFDAKRLNIKRIDGLKDVYYLPFGDTSYNNNFGIKKDAALNLKNEFFD